MGNFGDFLLCGSSWRRKFMRTNFYRFLCLLFLLILPACNFPSPISTSSPISGENPLITEPALEQPVSEIPSLQSTSSPTATIFHLVTPGAGAGVESSIYDPISGDTAQQGQPNQPPGGDIYLYNLYERPFNANTQDAFFPDLDIRRAEIGLSQPWM